MTFRFADPGRRLRHRFHMVCPCPKTGYLSVVILGTTWLYGESHFITKPVPKSYPCIGEADCNLCQARIGKRPKGWIAAYDCEGAQPIVLEATDGALDQLKAYVQECPGPWRGLYFRLRRKKSKDGTTSPTSPVEVFGISRTKEENLLKLPAQFDILPHLENLWGYLPPILPDDQVFVPDNQDLDGDAA